MNSRQQQSTAATAAGRWIPFCLWAVLLLSACARMGNPDGGWYDDDPPRIVGTTPADQSTGVTARRISIVFDEYIKLEDATQNVIVSPPQLEMPEIKAAGKRIIVDLQDSLIPNTTYTVDFSDAISDNNEGNPLGNYTYTFSTGERIDTFEVAGYVVAAADLEPVKGILVGLYADLADSVFRTKPLQRVARTDASGHFVIKGVAPGDYRVYALQDADGDYCFSQKSEMIAFSHDIHTPTAGPDTRQDTIWRDSLHIDNIIQVPYTHFYPDDIVMLAFQEVQTDRYLLKTERQEPNRIDIYFSYGSDSLPQLRGLNFQADSAFVLESSQHGDTLSYWLRDTALVNRDTLALSMQYLMTDTAGLLVSQTDTLELVAKTPYAKRLKALQKEMDDWQKEQDKRKKRDEPYDSIFPTKPLELKLGMPSSMAPNSRITLTSPTPLERLDTAAIHLYTKIDTLWYNAPFEFRPCEGVLRSYELLADWHPDTEYSLELDSAAFTDIYGLTTQAVKQGLKVKSLDEFSTLEVQLSGLADTTLVVQLLNKSEQVEAQVKADAAGVATFYYVNPGVYYLRAFTDRNGNGLWDTGLFAADRQPEDVYYAPREIECKEKWDISHKWNLTALPRHRQKPSDLVKQKGDNNKKQLRNRNADRARELGIDYNAYQARKKQLTGVKP